MASFRYTFLRSNWRCLVKNCSLANSVVKSSDMHFAFAITKSHQFSHLRTNCFSSLAGSCRRFQISHGVASRSSLCTRPVQCKHVSIQQSTSTRYFCQKPTANSKSTNNNTQNSKAEADQTNLTVFQRFKKTYKEHGKILIVIHCITSTIWFGSFYMAAVSGFDVVPLMEKMGFSDTLIKPFRAGGMGYVALAYLMYKLATPARYTVTLGGTNLAIRYLRRKGKMDKVPSGHSIRSLYKDGKIELRDRQIAFQQRVEQRRTKIRKQRVARNEDKKS